MSRLTMHKNVFQPLNIGKITLKNRIMSPPMMSGLATADGQVTDGVIAFARGIAKSGAGLVVMGETAVDLDRGQDHVHGTNLGSDIFIPGYTRLVEEIHRFGAKASIEISHPGGLAFPWLLNGKPAHSASKLPEYTHPVYAGNPVEVMSKAIIKQVVQTYVDVVGRAVQAGFDMVMIHAAHGWLLGQFLSPSYNSRTDEYGGSLENRMRFPLEILKAIRDEHGDKIALDMRISGASRVPKEVSGGEMEINDVLIFLKEAQKYLDIVNFSAGFIPYISSLEYMIACYLHPHMVNAEFPAIAKKVLDIPVTATGRVMTVGEADELIAQGKADLVGMGRAGLADGMTFVKAAQGRDEEIRPCTGCSHCGGRSEPPHFRPIRCAVNPRIGRELEYPSIPAAVRSKKIMIIGGGPAGMEATQICARRGHEVILYEQSDRLGGLLHTSSSLPFKQDLRNYMEWMIKETMSCGARVILGTAATPDTIKEENPDVVLVAIGSVPAIPAIPGIEGKNVVWAGDVDTGSIKTGQRVIVAGAGLTGAECALALIEDGKEVTLVDMIPPEDFIKDAERMVALALENKYNKLKIPVIFNAVISEITENGLKYVDKDSVQHTINGDTIVNALGMRVNKGSVDDLLSVVPESYEIGDCSGKKMNYVNAILDGFTIGMDL